MSGHQMINAFVLMFVQWFRIEREDQKLLNRDTLSKTFYWINYGFSRNQFFQISIFGYEKN